MASTGGARAARKCSAIWTYLFAVGACGGAQREALAPCRFAAEKTTLDSVNVSVPGQRFALGLKDVPSTIELAEGQSDVRLRVSAPLRFTAIYPKGKLPLSVATSTDLYGGRIRLGQGAKPLWLDVRGDSVRLSLERTLNIAMKQPLAIACSRLGLSNGSVDSAAYLALGSGERIGTGGGFVPLYLEPEASDPLDIRYPGALLLRERRPGWVRLEATWSDGSKLTGWTPERYTTKRFDGLVVPGEEWVGERCGRADAPPLDKVNLHAGAAISRSVRSRAARTTGFRSVRLLA